MEDAPYMKRAVALARRAEGFTHPNPMVGCVLVKDGAVIAEGWHEAPGREHAEAMALRLAGDAAAGATAYVTLEPCNHFGRTPPCSQALIRAGVRAVVFGMRDVNPQAEGGAVALRAAGIEARTCRDRDSRLACAELVRPWVHSIRCWRPWVTAKIAASLDGYTALPNGESRWITGEKARLRGHDLRQRTGAIMVGIGTVLADDPGLDPRPEGREPAPSLKVVMDTHLRTPPDAKLLATQGDTVIIASDEADASREEALVAAGATVVRVPGEAGRASLRQALSLLHARMVTDLMIEGGGTLLGEAFARGFVDEVWAFTAPVLLGDGKKAAPFEAPARLRDAFRIARPAVEILGNDILVRGLREKEAI